MGFFQIFDFLRGIDPLAEAVNRLARRSESNISQRVERRLASMSPDEGRGYIRARAATVIHRQVDLLLAEQRQIAAKDRRELIDRATEAVIVRVVEIHQSAGSRPHGRRRAA